MSKKILIFGVPLMWEPRQPDLGSTDADGSPKEGNHYPKVRKGEIVALSGTPLVVNTSLNQVHLADEVQSQLIFGRLQWDPEKGEIGKIK